jgi:hypothetical protein
MDDLRMNNTQKIIAPYIIALSASILILMGVITSWISIGVRSLNGTSSNIGKFSYLAVISLLILGLSGFISELQKFKRTIAAISGFVVFDILIGLVIWGIRALSALSDFNRAANKIDTSGGLLAGALSNLVKSIHPNIGAGFYIIIIGAIAGLASSIVIIFKPEQLNDNVTLENLSDSHLVKEFDQGRNILGIPQLQFVLAAIVGLGILGLVIGTSPIGFISDSTSSALGSLSSSNSNTSLQSNSVGSSNSGAFQCLAIENLTNVIRLNQPSFEGDPSPSDIFVATSFKLTNNCGKEIIGIKSTVDFQNVVGDTIFTGNYTNDQSIPVGGSITTPLDNGWTFNQFEDQYGTLAGTDAKKTKAVMTLSKVAFQDGTSLEG